MVGEAAAESTKPSMIRKSPAGALPPRILTRVDSKGVRNNRETRRFRYRLLGSTPVIDHRHLLDARNRAIGCARFGSRELVPHSLKGVFKQ